MKIRLLGLILCLSSSNVVFAFFCPTNFKQINIGDSFEKVAATCGAPVSQTNTKEEDPNIPQEWTYYVTMQPIDPQTSYGSVKIVVAFAQGKVINISSGGYSVGATSLCGNGNNIQMGSTLKDVKTACGKPVMVNKASGYEAQDTEVTEWKYSGAPQNTLIFRNGKLTGRQ